MFPAQFTSSDKILKDRWFYIYEHVTREMICIQHFDGLLTTSAQQTWNTIEDF